MSSQPTKFDFTLLPVPDTVKPVKEWNILDPSKLTVFEACPRKFFYEYILGWRRDLVNKHFIFGTAWHLAMEHISLNSFSEDDLALAYHAFLKYYRKFYDPLTDDDNKPKNPANARLALNEYADTWSRRDTDEYETLHTEIFVRVPVNDSGRLICGRMDKIHKHYERGIEGLDHKTGSKRSTNWELDWKLSMQMSFYYHVLNVAYPSDKIFGMMVDGMFFYKNTQKGEVTKNIPVRVPIRKSNDMHQAFLSDLNITLDLLDWNFEGLSKAKPDDVVMSAFPRRTKECVNKYNQLCAFHSFCSVWANPLKHCGELPIDFKIEHWDPSNPPDKPKPTEIFNPDEGFKTAENNDEIKKN